ncbi:MAG: hypothetical protein AAF628_28655 [Planctomycetota bacterium]
MSVLFACLFAPVASAQATDDGPRRGRGARDTATATSRFERLDRNGDGVVTRDELGARGADRADRGGRKGGERGRGNRGRRGSGRTSDRAPRDGNRPTGRPTRAQVLQRLDRNGNGVIDPEERPARGARGRGGRAKQEGGRAKQGGRGNRGGRGHRPSRGARTDDARRPQRDGRRKRGRLI